MRKQRHFHLNTHTQKKEKRTTDEKDNPIYMKE